MNRTLASQIRALQRQCSTLQTQIKRLERRCDQALGLRRTAPRMEAQEKIEAVNENKL